MNNNRRKRLAAILESVEDLKAQLEEIRDEEQDAFENMPYNLQESERGQQMEEAISRMEDAISDFDEAASGIEEAQNS